MYLSLGFISSGCRVMADIKSELAGHYIEHEVVSFEEFKANRRKYVRDVVGSTVGRL